jgi:uncharacterized protein (TIGR02421 family)
MQKLSELSIIDKIRDGELFECEILDGSFTLKIETYTPLICTAIHAGHNMRKKLVELCTLSKSERLYEEDPFTEQFIHAMPITLVALDSRYEYDLNRPIANCIYTTAWGKTVWQKKIPTKERNESISKHRTFYRVLDALVATIEEKFGAALLFDVHSYNYLRIDNESPTFNIGTEQIDMERWGRIVDLSLSRLNKVELPNLPVSARKNDVFFGRGYMIAHINSRFENSLVLPMEIKKIFMDEIRGEPYPLVMQTLNQQFKDCLVDIASFFSRRFTSKRKTKKSDMLTEIMDPAILKVDRLLYQFSKGLETLHYINPINIPSERKSYFKHNGNYQPQFQYRQLDIDPYHFREQLYRLPVNDIKDPSIQSLYRDVINGLSEKIALLVNAGQPDFLYESLKYYGEPSLIDEQNAKFILHAKNFEVEELPTITTDALIERFKLAASDWGMVCKIDTSTKLVASAMVSNSRKTVLIAKNLKLTDTEAHALIHHELGVHMATTINANMQPLRVFSLGLPGNTLTQEGLAILNEFQSGNMSLKRLKGLALRVLAVKEMLRQGDFRHTFSFLHEEYHLAEDEAFKLAVRVHRGGGFTKDYLYLNGVSGALDLVSSQSIKNLYIGKTGFDYLSIINEMVERQLLTEPMLYPKYLDNPMPSSPVLDYLMNCIRPTKRSIMALNQKTQVIAA